jgi:predicted lipid carrier protein YhbT
MRLMEIVSAEELAQFWQLVSGSVSQSVQAQLQQQARERETNKLRKATGRRPVRTMKFRAPVPPKKVPVSTDIKPDSTVVATQQLRSLEPIRPRSTALADLSKA